MFFIKSNPCTCTYTLPRLTVTGEKPHKCKECGARLATRGTLLLHLRTHTHEKPFVCSYCSKAFTSKWNLQTHLRQHTGLL